MELWTDIEVKDNDYYSHQLREMSLVSDLLLTGSSLLDLDAIIRELYLDPIIEQLNYRPTFLEHVPDPCPLSRRQKLKHRIDILRERIGLFVAPWIDRRDD